MSNPYGLTNPTPEGSLLLQALAADHGIEVSVLEARSAIAKFYTVRNNLAPANPMLKDLQLRIMNPSVIWIFKKGSFNEKDAAGIDNSGSNLNGSK